MTLSAPEKPNPVVVPADASWPDVPAAEPKRVRMDPAWKAFGAVAIVLGIPVALFGGWIVLCMIQWQIALQPPGVVERDRWPLALAERVDEWTDAGADLDGLEVYATDGLFNLEAYCRLPDRPETWAVLKERYAGEPSTPADRTYAKWIDAPDLPAGWTPDLDRASVEIYRSPSYEEWQTSQIAVARDPERGVIYFYYYFDF